jgi:hypothetical protein
MRDAKTRVQRPNPSFDTLHATRSPFGELSDAKTGPRAALAAAGVVFSDEQVGRSVGSARATCGAWPGDCLELVGA